MYPDITPKLRVEETISNPFDPAEILAFVGRNKKLGNSAVIVKESAVTKDDNGPVAQLPAVDVNTESEFIVLTEDMVFAMTASDFAVEQRLPTVHRGGQTVEMVDVPLSSDQFRKFRRSAVKVGN